MQDGREDNKQKLIILTGYKHPSINVGLAFQQRGFEILFHRNVSDAAAMDALPSTDAVLIHLPENFDARIDVLDRMLSNISAPVIVAESAPMVGQALTAWVDEIESKISIALSAKSLPEKRPRALSSVTYVKPEKQKLAKMSARHVWVLGASFGGPDALRAFLRQLPVVPGLGFIVAQHIGAGFSHLLCEQLSQCTRYHVITAQHGFRVFQGEIMVVPSDKLFCLDKDGTIYFEPPNENVRYSPSISHVMMQVAMQYGKASGTVLFSGMGDDGKDVCEKAVSAGMCVWAQSPTTCISASMPENAIGTGFVTEQGAPEKLALELASRFKEGTGNDLSN